MTLPANLRRLREAAGLTVMDVCKHVGCRENTVYRWERGEYAPVEETKERLAALYGCRVADFYEENEDE